MVPRERAGGCAHGAGDAHDAGRRGGSECSIRLCFIAFAPDVDDGGSPITKYTASCASSDGGDPVSVDGFGDLLYGFLNTGYRVLTVEGATAGKTYTCTLTASNANGDSPPSEVSSPTVVVGKPVHSIASATVGATSIAARDSSGAGRSRLHRDVHVE